MTRDIMSNLDYIIPIDLRILWQIDCMWCFHEIFESVRYFTYSLSFQGFA